MLLKDYLTINLSNNVRDLKCNINYDEHNDNLTYAGETNNLIYRIDLIMVYSKHLLYTEDSKLTKVITELRKVCDEILKYFTDGKSDMSAKDIERNLSDSQLSLYDYIYEVSPDILT